MAETRKMEEADLAAWKSKLELAKQYQRKHGNAKIAGPMDEGRWDTNVRALDGDFNSRAELGDEAVDVNVTHATIQTLFSPLWTTEPYIVVNPTCAKYMDGDEEADNILRARLTEYELNYWLRELNVRRVVRKCILDNAATNQGFACIGYIEDKSAITNDEGENTENEPQIRLKAPFIKRISPKQILIPQGYYELEEAPWVAIGWLKPVCDVRDKFGIEDLKADVMTLSEREMDGVNMTAQLKEYLEGEDAGYVMLWEVWDKRTKKLISLTVGHDDALEVRDWPFDLEGFSTVKMRFNWTPDQQFGMPIMSAWMPQQKELNAARTTTRIRESRIKGVIFVSDTLPEGAIDGYQTAPDGSLIRVPTDDGKISDKIMPFLGLPPAQNAYTNGQTQIGDLMMISGLGQQQRGMGDPNIDSATASALVDKWAQIRQTDMGDTVRTFYIEIARKLWMLLKEFPDTKRDMLVLGPDGFLQRITYTLADLKGEFHITMDLATLYSEDPITRQRNAMTRYNLLRQDPLIRPDKLIADVLATSNIYNPEAYMMTLLSPPEEFQKILSGLPVEANELDDHIAHMKAHDQQGDQLSKIIATSQAGGPEETKARTAMLGLLAHVNDHSRIMAEMDTKKGGKAGSPVAENTLRAQTANAPSGETQAEMSGQPQGAAAPEMAPQGA